MNKTLKNQKGFTAVEALLIILILVVVGGVGYMVYNNQHKSGQVASKSAPSPAKKTASLSDVCYIQSPSIVCVNQTGANPIKHSLPSVSGETIEQLAPNPNDTKYVASTSKQHLFILNEKLNVVSELTLPNSLQTFASSIPTWSHDGKSLFMELDSGDISSTNWRQLYRYDIATQKYTKLTSSGLSRTPFETKDGHIVYLYMNGDIHSNTTGWESYIMNSDGTDAKPFASYVNSINYSAADTSDSSPSLDLNYDLATDTVFVDSAGPPLTYETVNDLLAGKAPTTISVSSISGSVFPGSLVRISNNRLLYISSPGEKQPTVGQFIDVSNGNVMQSINNFGSYIIGVLPNASSL